MAARQFHLAIGKKYGMETILCTDGLVEVNVFHLGLQYMPHQEGRIYLYGELPTRNLGFEFPADPDLNLVAEAIAWYSNTYFAGMIKLLVALPASLMN